MQTRREERSLGELFSDLTRELGALVRQEITLAKTEMTTKASRAGKDVGFLAVGGAVAYAGFLAILAAIILALALVLPGWLAAAIVGIVVAALGGFLVMRGLSDLKRENLAPEQTIQTLQEDATWAKGQMS